MIRRIEMLRFAQQAGFTLDEIKTLLHGFDSSAPLSARWQKMARDKLKELDELAQRVQTMRRTLELGMKCGCVRLEDCSLSPADVAVGGRNKAASSRGCTC